MVDYADIRNLFFNLRDDLDDFQVQIYIVAGVLGAASAALLLCFLVMICVVLGVYKKISDVEENRRVTAEISARKYSAYTGEEVHRRLKSATPVEPGNINSEYAFNHPVSVDYALNNPPARF